MLIFQGGRSRSQLYVEYEASLFVNAIIIIGSLQFLCKVTHEYGDKLTIFEPLYIYISQ